MTDQEYINSNYLSKRLRIRLNESLVTSMTWEIERIVFIRKLIDNLKDWKSVTSFNKFGMYSRNFISFSTARIHPE